MNDQTNNDYLPAEIMECLSTEKPYSLFDCENLLLPNKKKKNLNKSTKTSKLPKYVDISSLRGDQIEKLNFTEVKPSIESIIPEEYWIIKEDLRRFIEYNDRELESMEESDQNQIVFPTAYPRDRHEVKCLQRTLRLMLDDIGRPDEEFANFQIESRQDLDILLEYVIRQEGVYNVILHELGRQTATMCEESGATVMELRHLYTDLVNNIPEELMRLKDEVKEQVVKDGKLLLQIEEFQSSILYLTDRLRVIKNQDIKVTKNADTLTKELEAAMQDSERSKELLNEYHVLYDLQKQRLDQQMSSINIEKEEWSSLAFALSLKISDESLLSTTKRLRLITKKLIQLSQHFAIYISECDTEITTKIQDLSDRYLKTITMLHTTTSSLTNKFFDLFHFLKKEFDEFAKKKVPDPKKQLNEILTQITSMKGFLGHDDLKKFMADISSECVATYQEEVTSMDENIQTLEPLIDQLSERRGFLANQSDQSNQLEGFRDLFTKIKEWNLIIVEKLKIIANFQSFCSDFLSRVCKIETEVSTINLGDDNSAEDKDQVDYVSLLIEELYIETFDIKEFTKIEKNEDFSSFIEFSNAIEKSMVSFRTEIDGFDATMMASINSHQDSITRWLVDIIFLLSDMSESSDPDIKYSRVCETFARLISLNNTLYEYVTRYTEKFIAMAVVDKASMQTELEEYRDENQQWGNVAEILIRNIGETIEQELIKRRKQSKNIKVAIDMDNIEELLAQIESKSTDDNIYLSVKSVRTLKSELESTEKRISDANESKSKFLADLQETLDQVKEYENKIEELTMEYHEYTRI